jgi:hypothetical protein
MNRISNEHGVEEQPKKKKKKGKKDQKPLTPEEQKIAKEKSKLKEIYDCLMFSQCQIQYAKYGSYIALENMGQIGFDVRAGQQFLFYILFSLVTGALSNPKQTKGISFSRAIAIVFLFNEIEQLFHYQ